MRVARVYYIVLSQTGHLRIYFIFPKKLIIIYKNKTTLKQTIPAVYNFFSSNQHGRSTRTKSQHLPATPKSN